MEAVGSRGGVVVRVGGGVGGGGGLKRSIESSFEVQELLKWVPSIRVTNKSFFIQCRNFVLFIRAN